jgi:hypothetical protein
MITIRRFAVLLLLVTSGAVASSAQQEMHGRFSLPYEVKWQAAQIPAGQYQFWIRPQGLGGMLRLEKLDGDRRFFAMAVPRVEACEQHPGDGQLVLQSISGQSVAVTMQLPEFGALVKFDAPSDSANPEYRLALVPTGTAGH